MKYDYINEIWKDIWDYKGLYQVSTFGRVKSLGNDRTRKEKIMKPRKGKGGYLRVNLSKDGIVHRLVALAFIPNDDLFKNQVGHLDENPENNCVLVYC